MFTYQRGETVSLALDCIGGSAATVTSVVAQLKPVAAGRSGVEPGTAAAAGFVVTGRGADGWTLTLPAAISAALACGSYLADARLTVAEGIVITEPVAIRIVEPVTS